MRGARPGTLAPPVRDALRADVQRIAASDDPLEIIRDVGDAFAALDAELARYADIRLNALIRLRADGWSYDRIAAATGLSKDRVARLARSAADQLPEST